VRHCTAACCALHMLINSGGCCRKLCRALMIASYCTRRILRALGAAGADISDNAMHMCKSCAVLRTRMTRSFALPHAPRAMERLAAVTACAGATLAARRPLCAWQEGLRTLSCIVPPLYAARLMNNACGGGASSPCNAMLRCACCAHSCLHRITNLFAALPRGGRCAGASAAACLAAHSPCADRLCATHRSICIAAVTLPLFTASSCASLLAARPPPRAHLDCCRAARDAAGENCASHHKISGRYAVGCEQECARWKEVALLRLLFFRTRLFLAPAAHREGKCFLFMHNITNAAIHQVYRLL